MLACAGIAKGRVIPSYMVVDPNEDATELA